MEKKIISTKDYLMVYPLIALCYVVSLLVIAIGAPYWAWMVTKSK